MNNNDDNSDSNVKEYLRLQKLKAEQHFKQETERLNNLPKNNDKSAEAEARQTQERAEDLNNLPKKKDKQTPAELKKETTFLQRLLNHFFSVEDKTLLTALDIEAKFKNKHNSAIANILKNTAMTGESLNYVQLKDLSVMSGVPEKKIVKFISQIEAYNRAKAEETVTQSILDNEATYLPKSIRKGGNRYFRLVERRDKEDAVEIDKYIEISNFNFEILAIYENERWERSYQLILTNKHGKKSHPFILPGKTLIKALEFKEICFSFGNFLFSGNPADLNTIAEHEIENLKEISVIKNKRTLGYIDKDTWLFHKQLYHKGKVYCADENDIIRMDDNNGYQMDGHVNKIYDGTPIHINEKPIDTENVFQAFADLIGQKKEFWGLIGLGFAGACIYSDVIFKEFRQFPFLFVEGISDSGKSDFVNFLLNIFGYDVEGIIWPSLNSKVPFLETLEDLANIPVWFDEFASNPKITDATIQGAFARLPTPKGKKYGGTEYRKVTAPLIFTSETAPDALGLTNRCVFIPFPAQEKRTKKNVSAWQYLKENKSKLSFLLYEAICERSGAMEQCLVDKIKALKIAFQKKVNSSRTAIIYAIAVAGLSVWGYEDSDFEEWLINSALDSAADIVKQENTTTKFLDDVIATITVNEDYEKFFSVSPTDPNIVRLCFNVLYKEVAKFSKYYKKETIKKYFANSLYFQVEKGADIKGKTHRSLHFYLDKMPEHIQEYFNDTAVYLSKGVQ